MSAIPQCRQRDTKSIGDIELIKTSINKPLQRTRGHEKITGNLVSPNFIGRPAVFIRATVNERDIINKAGVPVEKMTYLMRHCKTHSLLGLVAVDIYDAGIPLVADQHSEYVLTELSTEHLDPKISR